MDTSNEVTTIAQLSGLIKQKRNADIKAILLKDVALNLATHQESSSLMHTAVTFNNIEVIALLYSCGFDINTKNSTGQTPLLLAVQKNSHQAIQLLLAFGADVLIQNANGKTALQLLMRKKRNVSALFIGNLLTSLKRSGLSVNEIAKELIRARCPFECILTMEDAAVIRAMVPSIKSISHETSSALLDWAMNSGNMENVRVILQYGPDASGRRELFCDWVTDDLSDPANKPYLEQLVNWNLVDTEFLKDVKEEFKNGNEENIQIYLDIGMNEYYKKNYDRDLMFDLYHNKNIDVVKLLKTRHFDVNQLDYNGDSVLHVAVRNKNKNLIELLLNRGANTEVRDRNGQTPLFHASDNIEIAQVLVEAGANIQAEDDDGQCIPEWFKFNDFIVAHLTILEARGILLTDTIYDLMNDEGGFEDFDKFQQNYYTHGQDLKKMKMLRVTESITLFMVLTEKIEYIARYVKDEKVYSEIFKAIRKNRFESAYDEMLMKNLKRACELNELKLKAAIFLSDKMQIADSAHLVIGKIIEFLTYKDLKVFNEM